MSHAASVAEDPPDDYYEWERRIGALAFARIVGRRAKLKRLLDCGHWIDGSELYRYQVWLVNGDEQISQRTDCEVCARVDLRA